MMLRGLDWVSMIYIQTLENFRATRISMFFECRLVSKQFFWQQRWCDLAQSYPRVDTAATLITDRNCRCLSQNKVKIHFSLQFLCNCAFHILFWISFLLRIHYLIRLKPLIAWFVCGNHRLSQETLAPSAEMPQICSSLGSTLASLVWPDRGNTAVPFSHLFWIDTIGQCQERRRRVHCSPPHFAIELVPWFAESQFVFSLKWWILDVYIYICSAAPPRPALDYCRWEGWPGGFDLLEYYDWKIMENTVKKHFVWNNIYMKRYKWYKE